LRQGVQRTFVFEHHILLRQDLDPAVGIRQIIQLADLDACNVIKAALAVEIAADALGHFAFLPRNIADMGNEFFP
jgi:hypothetical protein